jgi:hypothetical protein
MRSEAFHESPGILHELNIGMLGDEPGIPRGDFAYLLDCWPADFFDDSFELLRIFEVHAVVPRLRLSHVLI